VFGLLPTEAIVRSSRDRLVKPTIRTHLQALDVPASEALVEILKAVADQFWSTWPLSNRFGNTRRRPKGSIADLRANLALHKRLRETQGGRCAVCGSLFEAPGDETLDHTVPFRLIGDVPDGANWQILCPACNLGKAEYFSALQSVDALNWVYRDSIGSFVRSPSLQTRYLALAQSQGCEYSDCNVTPRSAQLLLQRASTTGSWLADNLEVRCSSHAAEEALSQPSFVGAET
jgi:hypothetical protein